MPIDMEESEDNDNRRTELIEMTNGRHAVLSMRRDGHALAQH